MSFASALQFRRQRVSSQRFSFDVSVSRLSASVLMSAAFASTFQFRSLRVLPQLFNFGFACFCLSDFNFGVRDFSLGVSIAACASFAYAFHSWRQRLLP
jgi:hypothetical protein